MTDENDNESVTIHAARVLSHDASESFDPIGPPPQELPPGEPIENVHEGGNEQWQLSPYSSPCSA